MFAEISKLRTQYIKFKYGEASRSSWQALAVLADSIAFECIKEKHSVYENGPKVHGPTQQSRLDLLDKWQDSAEQIASNARKAAQKALT